MSWNRVGLGLFTAFVMFLILLVCSLVTEKGFTEDRLVLWLIFLPTILQGATLLFEVLWQRQISLVRMGLWFSTIITVISLPFIIYVGLIGTAFGQNALWLAPGALLLALLVQSWWVYLTNPTRKRLTPTGLCEKCSYDMRATPQRCPECGTIPTRPINPSGSTQFRGAT